MKTAHQGVAVASLPGLTGGMTASVPPLVPSANVPPAPGECTEAAGGCRRPRSIGCWSRLFGRRCIQPRRAARGRVPSSGKP